MTARFRPVWLVTDPITGGRGVLGFMVDDGVVGFIPSASTVWPTAGTRRLADLVTELLTAEPVFEDPPLGAGPPVLLGDVAEVPMSVADARRWVASAMLADQAA